MILDNCTYDKVKMLHELSSLLWFIRKHAVHNATQAGNKACFSFCEDLEKDIESHIQHLKELLCK